MALSTPVSVNIGANTKAMEKDISRVLNRTHQINLKSKGSAPLGRITGQVNEFNKSLEASNSRVIAFGASAGIIYAVQRAMAAMLSTTIEVQKSLQDINVILNVSNSELTKFGGGLFKVAKDTGQSFAAVAEAATEFSRQGLGMTETLKRTKDALILTRLSGLDTVKSVESLTAAINSFASQAVTATEIVNKFANVDAAFAVSSADLAEGIARVGSSAASSGIQLDQLIALITSAQQTTARGGKVIGNSFKTIFTRLNRSKTVDLMESLGLETRGADGRLNGQINLLKQLAQTYDTLGQTQQAYVAEQVGGVFQINVLKALFGDLTREVSIYDSALEVSKNTATEAYDRNEKLNETYAAQLNALKENAAQLAAQSGGGLMDPLFDRTVGLLNPFLESINEKDYEDVGTTIGRGLINGLGEFIGGPGLAMVTLVVVKLGLQFAKFASQSVLGLANIGEKTRQLAQLSASVSEILAANPALINQASASEDGLNKAAQLVLKNLVAQNAALTKQAALAKSIATTLSTRHGVMINDNGDPIVRGGRGRGGRGGRAEGYIPNFAAGSVPRKTALREVSEAKALGAKNPTAHMGSGTIGGKRFAMNSEETEIPNFGRNGDSAVIPHYSNGFAIAAARKKARDLAKKTKAEGGTGKMINEKSESIKMGNIAASQFTYLHAGQGGTAPISNTFKDENDGGKKYNITYSSGGVKQPKDFRGDIDKIMGRALSMLAKKLYPDMDPLTGPKGLAPYLDKSAITQHFGRIFDSAANRALGVDVSRKGGGEILDVSREEYATNKDKLKKIFNLNSNMVAGDYKFNAPRGGPVEAKSNELSFIKKILRSTSGMGGIAPVHLGKQSPKKGKRGRAAGFVPNFTKMNKGVPISQIRAHFDGEGRPVAVTNTRDEKNGLKDAIGRETKGIGMSGAAAGFVPNYALAADGDANSATNVVGALVSEMGMMGVMFGLMMSKGAELTASYDAITKQNALRLATEKKHLNERITENTKAAKLAKQRGEGIKSQIALDKQLRKASRKNASASSGPTVIQKAGAKFGGAGSVMMLSMMANIIAATIAPAMEDGTQAGRAKSSAVTGVGQIAAMATMGFVLGQLPGAIIGGTAGLALAIVGVSKELATMVPELKAISDKDSQAFVKLGDAAKVILNTAQGSKEQRAKGKFDVADRLQKDAISQIQAQFMDQPDLAIKLVSALVAEDITLLGKTLTGSLSDAGATAAKSLRDTAIAEASQGVFSKAGRIGDPNFLEPESLNTLIRSLNVGKGKSSKEIKLIQNSLGESKLGERPENPDVTVNNQGRAGELGAAMGAGTKTEEQKIYDKAFLAEQMESVGISASDMAKMFGEGEFTHEQVNEFMKKMAKSLENSYQLQLSAERSLGMGNPYIEEMNMQLRKMATNYKKLADESARIDPLAEIGRLNVKSASRERRMDDAGSMKAVRDAGFGDRRTDGKKNLEGEREALGLKFEEKQAKNNAPLKAALFGAMSKTLEDNFKNNIVAGDNNPSYAKPGQVTVGDGYQAILDNKKILEVLPNLRGIVNSLIGETSTVDAPRGWDGLVGLDEMIDPDELKKGIEDALGPTLEKGQLDVIMQAVLGETKKANELNLEQVLQLKNAEAAANRAALNQDILKTLEQAANSFGSMGDFFGGSNIDKGSSAEFVEAIRKQYTGPGSKMTASGTVHDDIETSGRLAGAVLSSGRDLFGGLNESAVAKSPLRNTVEGGLAKNIEKEMLKARAAANDNLDTADGKAAKEFFDLSVRNGMFKLGQSITNDMDANIKTLSKGLAKVKTNKEFGTPEAMEQGMNLGGEPQNESQQLMSDVMRASRWRLGLAEKDLKGVDASGVETYQLALDSGRNDLLADILAQLERNLDTAVYERNVEDAEGHVYAGHQGENVKAVYGPGFTSSSAHTDPRQLGGIGQAGSVGMYPKPIMPSLDQMTRKNTARDRPRDRGVFGDLNVGIDLRFENPATTIAPMSPEQSATVDAFRDSIKEYIAKGLPALTEMMKKDWEEADAEERKRPNTVLGTYLDPGNGDLIARLGTFEAMLQAILADNPQWNQPPQTRGGGDG